MGVQAQPCFAYRIWCAVLRYYCRTKLVHNEGGLLTLCMHSQSYFTLVSQSVVSAPLLLGTFDRCRNRCHLSHTKVNPIPSLDALDRRGFRGGGSDCCNGLFIDG
jgi:hypothetical protein